MQGSVDEKQLAAGVFLEAMYHEEGIESIQEVDARSEKAALSKSWKVQV